MKVTNASVNGKEVTLTTTELPSNQTLTITYSGIKGLENNSDAFRYNVSVTSETAIEGLVRVHPIKDGIEDANVWKSAEGITIKAGSYTTKTDEYGYYKIPVNAGKVSVTPIVDGYWQNDEETIVVANKATTQNIDLAKVNKDTLEISGVVKNSATGASIAKAKVELQQNVNGEWKKVDECVTSDGTSSGVTGSYAFLNKNAIAPANFTKTELKDVYGNRANKLDLNGKYRVVVSKDLANTNLNDVYHSNTIDVTMNMKNANTVTPVSLTAVKEIKKVDATVTWNPNITPFKTADTDLKAKIELLATDGETVLATAADGTKPFGTAGIGYDLVKDSTTGIFSSKINVAELIGKAQTGDKKLQLSSGTYYLRIVDNQGETTKNAGAAGAVSNAVTILPIQITEGQDASGSVEVKKAVALTVNTAFAAFPEKEPADTAPDYKVTKTWTDSTLKVWKTINGVDVLVATKADSKFTATKDSSSGNVTGIKADDVIANLAAEGYKVTLENDYIQGIPTATVTLNGEAVNAKAVSVDAAGVLGLELDLFNEDGTTPLTLAANTTSNFTVELKDASGQSVKKYPITVVMDKDKKLAATASSAEVKEVTNGKVTLAFAKLPAGKYTAYVTADNFKDNNGKEKEVKMLLDLNSTKNVVNMIAQPDIIVKGALQFTDGTDATATKVLVFDAEGEKLVLDTDYTATINKAGSYEVKFTNALPGKYKVVMYGTGSFETQEQTVELKKGENTVNWSVVKGGEGQIVLNLYDEKGAALKDADVKVTLVDKYGEDLGETFGKTFTDGKFASEAKLPAGTYTVTVDDEDPAVADKYAKLTDTITIGTINSTEYKTEKVGLNQAGIAFKVSGTIAAKDATGLPSKAWSGYVVAFDKDGKIVATQDVTKASGDDKADNYTLNLSNGSYTISTYVDGNFVGSKTIEVKDRDQVNVDFTTTQATR